MTVVSVTLIPVDHGWLLDGDRWVLLNARGEQAEEVSLELLEIAGPEVVNRTLADDGWPPLPAFPDVACQLFGGPHDGRWVFLGLVGPPESMSFAQEPLQVAGVRYPPGRWDRYVLACEDPWAHDPGDPFRFQWDPA